jgi:hypothetical protein
MMTAFEQKVGNILHSPYFDPPENLEGDDYVKWVQEVGPKMYQARLDLQKAASNGAKSPHDFSPRVRAIYHKAKVALEESLKGGGGGEGDEEGGEEGGDADTPDTGNGDAGGETSEVNAANETTLPAEAGADHTQEGQAEKPAEDSMDKSDDGDKGDGPHAVVHHLAAAVDASPKLKRHMQKAVGRSPKLRDALNKYSPADGGGVTPSEDANPHRVVRHLARAMQKSPDLLRHVSKAQDKNPALKAALNRYHVHEDGKVRPATFADVGAIYRLGNLVAYYANHVTFDGNPDGKDRGKKGDLDPDGRWITISGNKCHVNSDNELEAGGHPALREALSKIPNLRIKVKKGDGDGLAGENSTTDAALDRQHAAGAALHKELKETGSLRLETPEGKRFTMLHKMDNDKLVSGYAIRPDGGTVGKYELRGKDEINQMLGQMKKVDDNTDKPATAAYAAAIKKLSITDLYKEQDRHEKDAAKADRTPKGEGQAALSRGRSALIQKELNERIAADVKPLADMKGDLSDSQIESATDSQLTKALKDIGGDHFRGLKPHEKDVIRRLNDSGKFDRTEAVAVVKAHRDHWVDRAKQGAESDAATAKHVEQLYGKMTVPQLEQKFQEMGGDIKDLHKAGAREIDGNGGRRTGPATANEAARGVGEEKLKLQRYIQDRKAAESASPPAPDAQAEHTDGGDVFAAGPAPKCTAGSIIKDIQKSGVSHDILGNIEKTGFVTNLKYLAKLPPKGKERDALLKASRDTLANRKPIPGLPADAPGQPGVPGRSLPYESVIQQFTKSVPPEAATVVGYHTDPNSRDGRGKTLTRVMLKDAAGRMALTASNELAPVIKLWPQATIHIVHASSKDSPSSLVFKHDGEVVGVLKGLLARDPKNAKFSGTKPRRFKLPFKRYMADAAEFARKKSPLDPEGRWITIKGNHTHITKDGEVDAGGPPAVREALAKSSKNKSKSGGGDADADADGSDNIDKQYAAGEAMHKELKEKGSLRLETPEGKRFTVLHKKDNDNLVSGYAIQPDGGKIGKYELRGKDEINGWLGQLKKVGGDAGKGDKPEKAAKAPAKSKKAVAKDPDADQIAEISAKNKDFVKAQKASKPEKPLSERAVPAGKGFQSARRAVDKAKATGGGSDAHTMTPSAFVEKYASQTAKPDAMKAFVGTHFATSAGTLKLTSAKNGGYLATKVSDPDGPEGEAGGVKVGGKVTLGARQLADYLHEALTQQAAVDGKEIPEAVAAKYHSVSHYLAGRREGHGVDESKLPKGSKVETWRDSRGQNNYTVKLPEGQVPPEAREHLFSKGFVEAWGKGNEFVSGGGDKRPLSESKMLPDTGDGKPPKELHQMTARQYRQSDAGTKHAATLDEYGAPDGAIYQPHHDAVESRLKAGLPVPAHVANDYPDLALKYGNRGGTSSAAVKDAAAATSATPAKTQKAKEPKTPVTPGGLTPAEGAHKLVAEDLLKRVQTAVGQIQAGSGKDQWGSLNPGKYDHQGLQDAVKAAVVSAKTKADLVGIVTHAKGCHGDKKMTDYFSRMTKPKLAKQLEDAIIGRVGAATRAML